MTKHFKRPLSILLTVMMVVGIFAALPITVSAMTYTVTYNPNDGEGVPTSIEYEGSASPKTEYYFNFSSPGSSFRNWNTKADGTGDSYRPIYDTLPQQNITLYAQWGQYDSVNNILYDPWYVTTSLPTTAGKYVLRNNVTLTSAWEVPEGATYLRLNGHSITLSGSSNCVIHICNEGSSLNLYDDENNNGIITGGDNDLSNAKDGGGVAISAAATFNMYGGKIYNNTAHSGGGGVAISNTDAVFNMFGGIIDGNRSLGAGAGGVRVLKGTFNMSGGTISNNTARDNGGGVNIDGWYDQVFNMSGGSITGNTASLHGGGGVGIDEGATFTMSGGSITGNTAASNNNFKYGGGVMVNSNATFNASGSAVVSGNNYAGSNDDVYLAYDRVINVNGAFTSDANIGVTKYNNSSGTFTSGYASNNSGRNPANDFFSNNSSFVVALSGNEAVLRKYNITWKNYDNTTIATSECSPSSTPTFRGSLPAKPSDSSHAYIFSGWTPAVTAANSDTTYTATYNAVEKHEHDGINFTYWNSNNSLPTTEGNYALSADVTISSTWTVPTGTTNLCLNGHTITQTNACSVIKNSDADTTLAIYDCGNTGNITGGYYSASGHYGAGIEFLSGHLILNGGTISGNSMIASGTGGGGVKLDDDKTSDGKTSTFVMNGGTISGNEAAYGGGVYVRRGVFTLNGGTISGNTAHTTDGGGVHIYSGEATLNMTGGTITGNTAKCGGGIGVSGGGNINISGGTIQGNNARTAGGGLCNQRGAGGTTDLAASISISGNPVITDNTVNNSTTSNIYLVRNNGADIRLTISDELTDGANMGVSLGIVTGVFTTDYSTYNSTSPNAYFFSDNSSYAVGFTGSEAQLTSLNTITWQNYDGTTITTDTVGTGATPIYTGATPEKPSDALYTYTFTGWSTEVVPADGDAVYTATFAPILINYLDYTLAEPLNAAQARANDGNFFNLPDNVEYTKARLLGVQRKELIKTESAGNGLRFVAMISSEYVNIDDCDFGFEIMKNVFTTTTLFSNAGGFTFMDSNCENAEMITTISCKNTYNTIVSEEYGNRNASSTPYKYVTLSISDIDDEMSADMGIAVRFYVKIGNIKYYAKYTNQSGVDFRGCCTSYNAVSGLAD